MYVCSLY